MDWNREDLTAEQRAEVCAHYQKHMLYGFLWAAGGTIVTVATMSSGRGGVIFWGAIVFGIFDFFKGLNGYLTYR